MRENLPLSVVLLAVMSVLFPLFGDSSDAGSQAANVRDQGSLHPTKEAGAKKSTEPTYCEDKRHRRVPMSCIEAFWEPLEHMLYPRWNLTFEKAEPIADKPGCCPTTPALIRAPEAGCLVPVDALPDGVRVRPVILTVPNPLVTDLKYEFDRAIDSISRAIEDAGYVRDRFYLPWLQGDEGTDDNACSNRVPGLLLFRAQGSSNDLAPHAANDVVAVIIVGETPTWGLDREVGHAALDVARRLSGDQKIPILGPFHSGSSESLRDVIDQWAVANRGAWHFRVVTGTASSTTAADVLTRAAPDPTPKGDWHDIVFQRTTLTDQVLLDRFYHYLVDVLGVSQDEEHGLPSVAMMSESGTVYARTALSETNETLHPDIRITFPLHIAKLRTLHGGSAGINTAEPSSAFGVTLAPSILTPSFAPDDHRLDTPRMLSSEAAASDDLVLNAELAQLAEQMVSHVGILASDAADTIFLADRVRHRVPNARLFFLYSEALLTHPAYAQTLYGALMVSPYAMFMPADRWVMPSLDVPGNDIAGFSGNLPVGLYNAMLTLLGNGSLMRGYVPPFESGLKRSLVPPVWISVVAETGSVPLAAIASDGVATDAVMAQVPLKFPAIVRTPRTWHYLAGVVLALAAFLTLGVLKAAQRDTDSPLLGGFSVFSLKDDYPASQFVAATSALASLLFVVALIGSLASVPLFWPRLGTYREIAFDGSSWKCALVYFFVSGAIVIALMCGWFRILVPKGAPRTGSAVLSLLVMAAVLLLAPVSLIALAHGRDGLWSPLQDVLLFYVRATDISALVSPVTPMIIVGWTLFMLNTAYLGRQRLTTSAVFAAFKEKIPGAPEELEHDKRLNTAVREVEEAIVSPWKDGDSIRHWLLWTPLVLGSCSLWFLARSPVSSIDRLQWIVGTAIVAACVVFCTNVAWMLFLRRTLFRLLKVLAAHPAYASLNRLPECVGVTPTTSVTFFGDQVRSLRERNEEVAALGEAVAKHTYDLQRWDPGPLSHVAVSDGVREAPKWNNDAEDPLASFAAFHRRIQTMLWGIWSLPKAYRPDHDRAPKSGSDLKVGQGWYWAAQEFTGCYLALVVRAAAAALTNLLAVTVSLLLLIVLSLESYPLEPSGLLRTFCWAGVVMLALTSLVTLFRLEKDPALSRIQKTDPGKVSWSPEFVAHLLLWIILPFIAFLATQYPDAVRQVTGWIKPVASIH